MVGHKICFYGEIRPIILKLSLLLLLIWSSGNINKTDPKIIPSIAKIFSENGNVMYITLLLMCQSFAANQLYTMP